ncbi:CoaE Dephospho-CoA kinase [Rhabdaerophilaceae bacterium]
MFRLGLTGSIGTGKSATASAFRALGVPVHDADAAVHALYRGAAAPLIEAAFPGTVIDGAVDRKALRSALDGQDDRFRTLESIIHPLVRTEETKALDHARKTGSRLIVLDVPLLFETGGAARCDAVLVTTVSAGEQKRRVLARPGMTEAVFHALVARQMPDSEKRRRAHAILDTGHGFEAARRDIVALLRALAPSMV